MTSKTPLAGFTVVITRPSHQAVPLVQRIQQSGGNVIEFPVLFIEAPAHPEEAEEILRDLANYDLAIFISANAVEYGLRIAAPFGAWPATLPVAAVGAATARMLEEHQLNVAIVPVRGFNSEALLACPEMHNVSGKRIIIFRGEGGRELLAQTLRQRGASVRYVEVYRRAKPAIDPEPLFEAWSRNAVNAIVVTSNEGLQNLFDLVGVAGQSNLRNTLLLVMSERAVELARQLGFTVPPCVVSPVSDEAVFQMLLQLARVASPASKAH